MLWLGCFLLLRYGIFVLLDRLTVHRGLVHSIPAGIGFGLATTFIAYHAFNASVIHAWLCGAFVTLGFIVHLLLDEFYSVDLLGKETAEKLLWHRAQPGSLNQPIGTVLLYLTVVGLFLLCPSPRPFVELIQDGATYRGVTQRLLPDEVWFQTCSRRLPSSGLPSR